MSTPLVMDIPAAAAYLGVTEHWVRESCIDGTIPAEMVRGRWAIMRPRLDAWLAGRDEAVLAPPREVKVRGRRRAA